VPTRKGGKPTPEEVLSYFKQVLVENPYTGTTEQIVTTSLAIAEASVRVKGKTFILWRDETGINEKVFSKLKKIGETLLEVDEKKRRDVVKRLPASYSAIYELCALKPEELVTAAKNGSVTPTMGVRTAQTYVKQVRFPRQFLTGDKGRWGVKEEHLYQVLRPEETNIGGEALLEFEKALRRLCGDFGLTMRKAGETSTGTLLKQDKAEREVFWRGVLEKELTLKWFQQAPDELKKQFNIRTHEELLDTPLRNFTGFVMKTAGGRDAFWEKHGQAYIAKLHLLQVMTNDNSLRHQYKIRLEQVFEKRGHLAVWRNILVKENGFIY
tara:strand:+ start:1831 stop:2805 length:975 start_codon:yes stop_codon:yes gene_type:complete